MKYVAPGMNPGCVCTQAGVAPMFCGTGHLLECHYPLDCGAAVCNHLPKYFEEFPDADNLQALESAAAERIAQLADKDCPECGGAGRVTVRWEEKLEAEVADFFRQAAVDVDPDHFPMEALRMCGCVVRTVEQEGIA